MIKDIKPLISVIIPVRNSERTISMAIESILNQTYKNIEVLIIDDFSEDSTADLVKSYIKNDSRITYLSAPFDDPYRVDVKLNRNINAGYSARNFGLLHAKGDYITFQDADDISFLNRIEIQYELLVKYSAVHITVDWLQLKEHYSCKRFDVSKFEQNHTLEFIKPIELYTLSQTAKGFIAKISKRFNRAIPFFFKRNKIIHKLFFGSLISYPGTGNSPLFKREVIDRVQFRPLSERVWPSFMGRGADRDFNFQVAETFKNSYVFFIPLYLWRQEKQNNRYVMDLTKYIID